jgi:hypothetical protein
MAGSDMAAWRRQNSDVITIEIKLVDGSLLRGTMLLQREKSLKYTFSSGDPFIEFDCLVDGEIVLAKTGIATIRQIKKGAVDVLERRSKALDKSDAFATLKIQKTADMAVVEKAYQTLSRTYAPEAAAGMPPEVLEYMTAMSRRVANAYGELKLLLTPPAAKAA